MKEWVLSQEGDQWSVKFDVRDVGGHLGTTFRGWSLTLAALLFLWISMIGRVVRSVFLPAALYRIEASFLASDSLWRASVLYSYGGVVSSSTFGWCWCCA